jgi:hypothetical protein
LPVKVIVPDVKSRVPALVISPATFKVPVFTLREELAGIVIPTAKALAVLPRKSSTPIIVIVNFFFKPQYALKFYLVPL